MNKKYIKLIMLFISIFVLSGCVNVKQDSIEKIVNYISSTKHNVQNTVNRGYKYYLPRNLNISYQDNLNTIIKSKYYDYYLYVDLISYFNNEKITYKKDDSLYYSSYFKDKNGMINVTKLSDSYLIHIEYNYAKIEVKVEENDIKDGIANALIIITSIEYNRDVINAMLDEGILSLNERPVEIFNVKTVDQGDFLDIDESQYEDDENKIDTDYIN